MFDADRPITNSAQDKLNRTQFAKYLARCMLDHKDPDSLVVGLYGGWGTGKTSIINMVVEELNQASSNMLDDEKPIILNFSPWSYSGQDHLLYNFFKRLSSTLKDVTYLKQSDEIIHLLELYISYFTRKRTNKLRTATNVAAKYTWLEKLVSLNDHKEVVAWESGRDLTKIKAELNALLRLQQHKIIIIIDNISRLYDVEVQQIFQIVKSIGDFANTSYLLAFDKEQIINKLNRLDEGEGEQFVEKVVQLPFTVPPIYQQDLEVIFAAKMEPIVATIPEGAWSKEHWADIYYSTLRYFFNNCRDITRYINTLNFSYTRLKEVVNPVDFFALTAIEIFEPDVYLGIQDNKDLFTDLLDTVYRLDEEQVQADWSRCDEIVARSKHVEKHVMLELISNLFPRIRRVYHHDIHLYYSSTIARKLRRISSPDLFDAYFRLSIQSGSIHSAEFTTILALAADKTAFEQALTRFNQDDRILKFLDLLDGHAIQSIPEKNFPAIIGGLIENGDLFPHGESGLLALDTPTRIHRIIHAMFVRIKNAKRYDLLKEAIKDASKSLYTLIHELEEQGKEHVDESDTYLPEKYRDLTPVQLQSLRKLAIDKIKFWANNGSLEEHPQLLAILKAWLSWDPLECQIYVRKITDTDKGLVIFLSQALAKPITEAMVAYHKDDTWLAYLDTIQDFIPAVMIEGRANALFKDDYFEKLRENEQLALMIFLDLIKSNASKTIPNTSD